MVVKMQSYDQVEGFINYTDKEEWKKYIETFVIPLWGSAWIIKEYFEGLKREFDNLPFTEIKDDERSLLLGGIVPNRDETYTRNSLAKFYAKFFGLRLKDIQSWILQQQQGEILTEINVEVVEIEFIKFVKEVFNLLDYELQYQTSVRDFTEPELNYEELKKDPNKVLDIIREFYQGLLDITINYNYGTFLLCSINQITYKYMRTVYPRIDEILDFLKDEFGLTELKWNNPIKPETKTFKDYIVFCFPEYNPNSKGKSFGGSICTLNEYVWKTFSYSTELKNTLSTVFSTVPDLKEEFKERVKTKLPEKHYSLIYYKGITASESSSNVEEGHETIMDMIDENSPHLFTNSIKISWLSDDRIQFESV